MINIAINTDLEFTSPFVFLCVMSLGKILGGFAVYRYHNNSLQIKQESKYFRLELLYNKDSIKPTDGPYKIILLIFFGAFFDLFFSFYNLTNRAAYPKFGSLTTIISSLICSFAFNFNMARHQKVSLAFMSLFLFLTIILEISYKNDLTLMKNYLFTNFLVCFELILASFTDCIEKYIVEANFISPFKIIMLEGILEFIISIFISINNDPFKNFFKEKDAEWKPYVLVALLILYVLISGIVNAYKIYCNVIYSPMARSLIDYFMAPCLNIFSFTETKNIYKHNHYIYIVLSEVLALVIDFCGLVYNEFLILYFWGLEHDTQDEIHKRSEENNSISDILLEEMDDIAYDNEYNIN